MFRNNLLELGFPRVHLFLKLRCHLYCNVIKLALKFFLLSRLQETICKDTAMLNFTYGSRDCDVSKEEVCVLT